MRDDGMATEAHQALGEGGHVLRVGCEGDHVRAPQDFLKRGRALPDEGKDFHFGGARAYRRAQDRFLVVVNAGNDDKDFAWMRAVLSRKGYRCTLTHESRNYSQIAVQGPRAAEILQKITATDLSAIKTYWFAEGSVCDGVPAILARTGYTGEDGFELYFDPAHAESLWRLLTAHGDVTPAGLGCRDSLRLEMGMALYGNDIDDTVTPWEANLNWLVKMKKGDFTGRAVLGGLPGKPQISGMQPEALVERARASIAETGGRGHLLGPDCSINPGTPDALLHAVNEALAVKPAQGTARSNG